MYRGSIMHVIVTTCSPQDAKNLLKQLLMERVVACGNITASVSSMYWWKGEIQDDSESFIFMETTDEKVEAALRYIEKIHPYDVPKILSWKPSHINEPYLEWLRTETTAPVEE